MAGDGPTLGEGTVVTGFDQGLVERLVATAESKAEGTSGPTVVVLWGRSGVGKTAVVQALHATLRERCPGAGGWAPLTTEGTHHLEHRKWVHARRPSIDLREGRGGDRGGGTLEPIRPWAWVGVECGPGPLGGGRAMAAVEAQLRLQLLEQLGPRAAVGGEASLTAVPEANAAAEPGATQQLRTRFAELASTSPTIVAVEDLHAADEAVVSWVRELLAAGPVLVVATTWAPPGPEGPFGLWVRPVDSVHVEVVEVQDLDPAAAREQAVRLDPRLGGDEAALLAESAGGNPLMLRVLLGSLVVQDALEVGAIVDDELLAALPGGAMDDLAPMWWRLPASVQSAIGASAELGCSWLPVAMGAITHDAGESALAELDGETPAGAWVTELDEHMAVWIDPVLQQVALVRRQPGPALEDLLELHRWVVECALRLAARWMPDRAEDLARRRRELDAAGLLPRP